MKKLLISLPIVLGLVAVSAPVEAAIYNDRFINLRHMPANRIIYLPDTGVRSEKVSRDDRCLEYDAYGKCDHEQRYYSPRTIRLRPYLQAEPTSINPRMNKRQGRCIIDFNSRGQVVNETCFDR